VFTNPIPIPSSLFDFGGEAACPAGTVPWGGGAGFSGGFAGHGENINTSEPVGDSWRARYNNSGPTLADHFAVEAICAKQPAGYTVAFSSADNPPHSQSTAVATCPTGTVLLSGGGLSTADTADVQQLSAFPLGPHRFRVVMWNGSSSDQRLNAFALCAKQPPRYSITNSTSTDPGGPADDSGGVLCPAGSAIIGGGIHITNPRPLVTLGASFSSSGNQWVSEVVTDDTAATTITISAICAA
jgi:hypothetical protein